MHRSARWLAGAGTQQPEARLHGALMLCLWACLAALLGGCASPYVYTTDDGRKVNEELLGQMRRYGSGERALRPAIARSAELHDAECDKQWELPIAVATSDGWSGNDRVAWVRALGVDERLTVIGNAPGSGLELGERLVDISGFHSDDARAMTTELAERRDAGKPFHVRTSAGKAVFLKPFEVCRGYTRLAPPNTPLLQDYHWLLTIHPLQVASVDMTDDEALWTVLWTQGLSEEGGTRMKSYHYTVKILGTLYDIATIATGLRGAALAAEAAVTAAKSVAASVATEVLKRQIIDEASAYARRRLTAEVNDIVRKLSQDETAAAMQQAARNRGNLSGVARVGATVFDRADTWALERMLKLNANAMAGAQLHQKLIEAGYTSNAMVFDPDRMASIDKVARAKGLQEQLVAALNGMRPDLLALGQTDMPLATRPEAFSFDSPDNIAGADLPFARGLVDGMLELPAEWRKN